MSCKISQLQDKTVSWVRRLADTNEMLLLTVGLHTYSSDSRFRVDFQFPDDWRLRIDNVTRADEGTYVCQISTHPPQAIQTNFYVSCKLITFLRLFVPRRFYCPGTLDASLCRI